MLLLMLLLSSHCVSWMVYQWLRHITSHRTMFSLLKCLDWYLVQFKARQCDWKDLCFGMRPFIALSLFLSLSLSFNPIEPLQIASIVGDSHPSDSSYYWLRWLQTRRHEYDMIISRLSCVKLYGIWLNVNCSIPGDMIWLSSSHCNLFRIRWLLSTWSRSITTRIDINNSFRLNLNTFQEIHQSESSQPPTRRTAHLPQNDSIFVQRWSNAGQCRPSPIANEFQRIYEWIQQHKQRQQQQYSRQIQMQFHRWQKQHQHLLKIALDGIQMWLLIIPPTGINEQNPDHWTEIRKSRPKQRYKMH